LALYDVHLYPFVSMGLRFPFFCVKMSAMPHDFAGAHSPDRISHWFAVQEERGEYNGIRFGQRPQGSTQEPEWVFLDHRSFDGIGGFAHLLRASGEPVPILPTLREPKLPSIWRRAVALLRVLLAKRSATTRWKKQDKAWKLTGTTAQLDVSPVALSCVCLSREKTAALLEAARERGVSLNTLLLWTLGRSLRPELAGATDTQVWLIPVNMRGPVWVTPATGNHSSFIEPALGSDTSITDLHRQITASLKRLDHWGIWHQLNIVSRFGRRVIRKVVEGNEKAGRVWVGCLSNLGRWESQNPGASKAEWFFAPPTTKADPFTVGAVTWDGRLSLTLQTHTSMRVSSAEVKEWLERWIGLLDQ
jgi:hypothetical protein